MIDDLLLPSATEQEVPGSRGGWRAMKRAGVDEGAQTVGFVCMVCICLPHRQANRVTGLSFNGAARFIK
jgi:hypothetical protein